MDGFVPRRSIGGREEATPESGLRPSFENSNLSHATDERELKASALAPEQQGGLTRSHLDQSLSDIELEDERAKRERKKHISKKKLIKRLLIALGVIILITGVVLGIKFLIASGNIFNGNILGLTQSQPLKMDENGRSNIVIFGTSEDSEGGNHPGAWLTDSIMVVSVDQNKKDAFTFNIPRDLWVQYDTTCLSGTEGRINALYACHSNDGQNGEAGTDALRKTLTEVTGMDIQYYAHVNYSVIRDAVNAVGGVEVVIESRDPRGILDRNFDWECNYECHYVKYENGPTGNMNGDEALALARARGSVAPTYGLERGNYDREIHQQKIAVALRDKALSAGTLTNFSKVINLMDAFGNNLRTNFETSEIRTLMSLGEEIGQDNIQSISLIDAEPAVFVNDNVGGASVVRSTNGFNDYSNIASYLRRAISSEPFVREEAVIGVYNATSTNGLARVKADELSNLGFTVTDVSNAIATNASGVMIYDLSNGQKPATLQKLKEFYAVEPQTGTPPVTTTGIDIVIILGAGVTAE